MTATTPFIKRALLSTSDKAGVVDFARKLTTGGYQLIATSGTASLLKEANIDVTEISEYTKFPEILNGRVKTLHPKIYAGLLCRGAQDYDTLKQLDIDTIDLAVINLYPFQETITQPNCTHKEAIEQIDIGGPAMIRAAAKNYELTTILIDPNDYELALSEILTKGNTTLETRSRLAAKAFTHTAAYDLVIANYLEKAFKTTEISTSTSHLPQQLTLHLTKSQDLRYGENPHQAAALYQFTDPALNKTSTHLLQGKPLSFNNMIDAETAIQCANSLAEMNPKPACIIIKHATPCGAALADSLLKAYQQAYQTDPLSAFGGIIIFNQPLDIETTQFILQQQFVEVLIAPDFSDSSLQLCHTKPNLRVIRYSPTTTTHYPWTFHLVSNGLLLQTAHHKAIKTKNLQVVTQRPPTSEQINDLLFAWHIAQFVKSNAIVLARNETTLGIGAGQTSRVFSTEISILKSKQAHLSLENAVMASDAFLPFPDNVTLAAEAGISAIIQTGGSKRDHEVIQAADQANITMIFTGIRQFRH